MLDLEESAALDAEVRERLDVEPAWHGEVMATRVGGLPSVYQTTIVSVKSACGDVVGRVQIFRDVTEARLLEERLRHAERLKSLGVLAGGVAHEFNNQLTGIRSAAEMLRRHLGDSDAQLSAYIEGILLATKRAAGLTTQLLTFARRGPMEMEPLDLNDMAREVVNLLTRSLDKRIAVRTELSDVAAYVHGDPNQLQSVLLNVAINARDAKPEGGRLRLSTRLVTSPKGAWGKPPLLLEAGCYVHLAVTDTGTGMADAVKRRIFEPFYTTKPQGAGVGMGLSAVFGVVQRHGGAIDVTSTPDHGTCFVVYLPVCDEGPLPATRTGVVRVSHPGGKRIMVVDDEELVLALATDILEMEGYEVAAFSNGRQALEYYESHASDVDAVVLDMMMPHLHGREVLAALRALTPDVRVVVCSGVSDGSDGIDAGPTDFPVRFVRKPYDLSDLLAAVSAVLSQPASP